MRWPIRNQILLPFLMIQAVMVAAIALASAWTAVTQVEHDIEQRLQGVLTSLESSTYPLTTNILLQLKQLSGAEVLVAEGGLPAGVSNIQSSLDVTPPPVEVADVLSRLTIAHRAFIDERSVVQVGNTKYFGGTVRRNVRTVQSTVLVLFPEHRWREARSRAVFTPLAIGALCLLLTIAASAWLARRVARRIQTLQQHVARIANGEFGFLEPQSLNDEVRDLTVGVNRMSETLSSLMRNIRHNERSAMLTQLVGGLAHQLRNSITGARTSLQLHQRHCSQNQDQAILVALRQLSLTEEQIKSLLRLAQGERSAVTSAAVSEVLDDVAALVQPICDHQKIVFRYNREKCHATVTDSDAMRGGLLNLLMNAIEAAGVGGQVELCSAVTASELRIEVSDSGAGVAAEHIDSIFEPFFTTKPEGAGLGLALARRAAEDCGGSVEYERRHSLSVFIAVIPLDSVLH